MHTAHHIRQPRGLPFGHGCHREKVFQSQATFGRAGGLIEIEISLDRLGPLRCRFAEPARQLLPSRWPLRPALQRYHA